MTQVSNTETSKILSFEDAAALYAPPPAEMTGKMGIEHEMFLLQSKRKMVGPRKMTALQNILKTRGLDAQLEAASVLEYAGPAFALTDIPALLRHARDEISQFRLAANQIGCRHVPLPLLPHATLAYAKSKMNDRPRLQTGIAALSQVSPHGAVAIALLTAGTQVSFSPSDNDQLFRMVFRGYALTPLILAAMNGDIGFSENEVLRKNHHIRANAYSAYGNAGGISQAFLNARDGDSFIKNHYDEVIHTPMYFAYAPNGALSPSTSEHVHRFAELPVHMKTRSNYELAESFMYHDIKVCNLRDQTGHVVGKRLEVRGADSGLHQDQTMPLLTAALIPDGPTANKFAALLGEFGFTGNPADDANLLCEARYNAVYHRGKFMNVAFGRHPRTREPKHLMDFAAQVATLLENHYAPQASDPHVRMALSKLTRLLRTGQSDAARYAASINSLEEAKRVLYTPGAPRSAHALQACAL